MHSSAPPPPLPRPAPRKPAAMAEEAEADALFRAKASAAAAAEMVAPSSSSRRPSQQLTSAEASEARRFASSVRSHLFELVPCSLPCTRRR